MATLVIGVALGAFLLIIFTQEDLELYERQRLERDAIRPYLSYVVVDNLVVSLFILVTFAWRQSIW